jgi:hypothetical protein
MSGRGGDPAWAVWLSVAGLLALIAAGVFVIVRFPSLLPAPPTREERIEQQMLDDQRTGVLARTIKEEFPEEFDRLKRTIADLERERATPGEIRAATAEFTTQAIGRHTGELARAPHDPLTTYRRAELRVLEYLEQESPDQCARLVVEGSTHLPPIDDEARLLQVDMQVGLWKAAAAGRDRPAKRELESTAGKDRAAFIEAMRAVGMRPDELAMLDRIDSVPYQDQCYLGVRAMQAVDSLPEAVGDRVYTRLLLGTQRQ